MVFIAGIQQKDLIHVGLSQHFHQSSKDILQSLQKIFFINFHQKLVFCFCFKHLLKDLNQGQYKLTHTVLLENLDQLL